MEQRGFIVGPGRAHSGAQCDERIGQSDRGHRLVGDTQHDGPAVAGQRERRRVVARQQNVAPRHPIGQRLGGIGEQLAGGAVAQRLGIQFVGDRGQIHDKAWVDHTQGGQAGAQIAGQAEVIGNAHPRFQHGGPASGGVSQRSVVGSDDHDPRTATHPRRCSRHQDGVAGVVAGDDENVQRADPWRRL